MPESQRLTEGSEKASGRRTRSAVPPAPSRALPHHAVTRLQRQVGNQAVAGLLAQRQTFPQPGPVQAKHASADDEQVGLEGGPLGQGTAAQIHALRGRGQPLEPATRTTMEQHFTASFADVRVHAGGEAAALNSRISARAFTTGNDIFLRDPTNLETPEGKRLLAHELTHVVQQRSMPMHDGMEVRPAGDQYEQAADAKAAAVVASAAAPAPAAAPGAQRELQEE
ncbi:MAG: DUF4157 domain-containing protein [Chloroflexi bacterium]|nr:DUF4157 domain-containing protein [Chloroflexota bacterium]